MRTANTFVISVCNLLAQIYYTEHESNLFCFLCIFISNIILMYRDYIRYYLNALHASTRINHVRNERVLNVMLNNILTILIQPYIYPKNKFRYLFTLFLYFLLLTHVTDIDFIKSDQKRLVHLYGRMDSTHRINLVIY